MPVVASAELKWALSGDSRDELLGGTSELEKFAEQGYQKKVKRVALAWTAA